jgi:hypothetical protein
MVPVNNQCFEFNTAEACKLYNENYKDRKGADGTFKVRVDPTDNKSLACIDDAYRYACASQKCRPLGVANLSRKETISLNK